MSNDANWYGEIFKGWQAKQLGPKPTAEQLATVHNLKARPGKQALAIAMGLRDCGVTGSQIVIACGAPQLNKMRGFIEDALLKRVAVPMAANGHQVYKLEVTAKGKQRIERTEKALAAAEAEGNTKAAEKAVSAVKPKAKAKVAKVKKPTSKAAKAKVPANELTVTERPEVEVPQSASAELLPASQL